MSGRRLVLKVMEPVQAELMLVTPAGSRPPTDPELRELGYVSSDWLKQRMLDMVAAIGDDETSGALGAVRYFMEYLATYQHDVPEEAIEGMRQVVRRADEHPEGTGTGEGS